MQVTYKQKILLEKWGIKIPKSKKIATRIITFIISNNGRGAGSEYERIAQFKAFCKKYTDKKIRYNNLYEGKIVSVYPKTIDEVSHETYLNENTIDSCPFKFSIQYKNGEGKIVVHPALITYINLLN